MTERLMITLDGSPFAERALEFATDLAQQRQAELCLIQVLQHESERPEGEKYLQSQAKRVTKHQVRCSTRALLGSPDKVIVKQSINFDLLIMSSHGHSRFDQLILGSVAEKVVKQSHCPVLVTRDRQIRLRDCKRILVPLDGFESSLKAIPEALKFCRGTGGTLVLARIDEVLGIDLGLVSRGEECQKMEDYLENVAKTIESTVTVETAYKFGSASRTLLRLVERENIDLVVMTSHGHGGFKHLFFGSVAENVLQHSLAPVLVLRDTKRSDKRSKKKPVLSSAGRREETGAQV